jgi:putative peptidoglycan lipid II flippase
MVGVAETIILYLLIPGLLWFLLHRLSVPSAGLLLAALAVLILLGLVNSNLGNLHRIRYPFHFIPMLLGLIGWFEMLQGIRKQRQLPLVSETPVVEPVVIEVTQQQMLTKSSDRGAILFKTVIWVMLISMPGYIGFFLRDIIMARVFGLGAALDAFQVGIVLPTFFAAILLVPLTSAVVPEFTRLSVQGKSLAERWIQSMIGLSLCGSVVSAVFCSALWWLLGTSNLHPPGADAVFVVALLILLLSSWVNIGNGLLNTSNAQRTAAVGQSMVPWAPIILLLIFGQHGSAVLIAIGMVVGQIVNLGCVIYGSHKAGFRLWPRFFSQPAIPRSFLLTYLSVVATSFLFGAAMPLGITLALRLGKGQAGAFALGYKLVVLTYAVASAITTAVVVPYFSRHFVSGDTARAHRGLVKFMHLSLLVSVPAAAMVFGLADRIVSLFFGGGRFGVEDGRIVAAVVQSGSLQIPFMLTNLLIVRFSEASARAMQALIVTLLAQAVTIVIALFGVDQLGVNGIALAGSVGVIAATLTFVIFLIRENVLSWLDAGVSLIGWWLFLTICLCVYFDSTVGVLTAGAAFLTLILLALRRVLPATARVF